MNRIALFGATSAIAQETARLFAAEGAQLFLVGRDDVRLRAVADDLLARGARAAHTSAADLADVSQHQRLVDEAMRALGGLDGVLIAHGVLPGQAEAQADAGQTLASLQVNLLSPVSLLTRLAPVLEQARAGTICVIGSVAGDRGRPSNYVYGAGKGGLATFLQGLRARLAKANVRVITVKPGFVDTPMTAAFPKNPLFASAATVGRGIHRAMRRGADVVYLPWFWRYIMLIIRLIPEGMFKRLKL